MANAIKTNNGWLTAALLTSLGVNAFQSVVGYRTSQLAVRVTQYNITMHHILEEHKSLYIYQPKWDTLEHDASGSTTFFYTGNILDLSQCNDQTHTSQLTPLIKDATAEIRGFYHPSKDAWRDPNAPSVSIDNTLLDRENPIRSHHEEPTQSYSTNQRPYHAKENTLEQTSNTTGGE